MNRNSCAVNKCCPSHWRSGHIHNILSTSHCRFLRRFSIRHNNTGYPHTWQAPSRWDVYPHPFRRNNNIWSFRSVFRKPHGISANMPNPLPLPYSWLPSSPASRTSVWTNRFPQRQGLPRPPFAISLLFSLCRTPAVSPPLLP